MYLKYFMKLTLSQFVLRFAKMILMVLAYKLKQDFWQNLPKARIFHPYITDAFQKQSSRGILYKRLLWEI